MIPNISLANFMKTNEKLFDCYFVQFTIDVLFAFCLSVCLCVRVCTRAEYKCVFILTCSVFSLRCCLNGRNILRFECLKRIFACRYPTRSRHFRIAVYICTVHNTYILEVFATFYVKNQQKSLNHNSTRYV